MRKEKSFAIKRGDTLPLLKVLIIDDMGQCYPIEGISKVVFRMFNKDFEKQFEKPAQVVDSCTLQYCWDSEDTDRVPGIYYGEFEIWTSNGKNITVPNNGWIEIVIRG